MGELADDIKHYLNLFYYHSSDNHLREISQEILHELITKVGLKIVV